MSTNKTVDQVSQRKQKLASLRQEGINPFPNGFVVPNTIAEIKDYVTQENIATAPTTVFTVAGRIMAINSFGKSAFIRFRDRTGQMQSYIRKDKIGNDSYSLFKKMDIGDFVGLTGSLFQTKTKEWTLLAEQCVLLTKSCRPLPEKFHGLKDPEKRYRQRYPPYF